MKFLATIKNVPIMINMAQPTDHNLAAEAALAGLEISSAAEAADFRISSQTFFQRLAEAEHKANVLWKRATTFLSILCLVLKKLALE